MDDMGGFRRRGAGRGGRGGRGPPPPKREVKSQEDLDKAMDSYWNSVTCTPIPVTPALHSPSVKGLLVMEYGFLWSAPV